MESWRILLHLAAALDWDAQQIDIKTAFLYGLLPKEEYQYMEQPPEFEEPGKEDWVWVIQCGLYRMKQSRHIWNIKNEKMLSWGFNCLSCKSCVYYRKTDTGTVVCAVHVESFYPSQVIRTKIKASKTKCARPGPSQILAMFVLSSVSQSIGTDQIGPSCSLKQL